MSIKQVKRVFLVTNIIIGVIAIMILAFNSVYIIQEQEQAVVITLGKPTTVTTPGPHFKIPFIQDVKIVSMVINGFSIGYRDQDGNASQIYNYPNAQNQVGSADMYNYNGGYVVQSESLMITSDYNFVNVDFFLEYKVSDPERYLFASDRPEFILRNMALSYIRDTIGLHTVDEVITTGKNEIQAEIQEKLSNRLLADDIGIHLHKITIQDSEPPTDEVKDAFKNVETTKQGKETAINTARKYESEQLPAARAQEDSILKLAESQKAQRISEAQAQVAVFNAMYQEYSKNPVMTRQRMFYEAMEELLPGMKIIIDNGDGSLNKILPLDTFDSAGLTAASAGSGQNTED